MTGWTRIDRLLAWAEANPDRVFYAGLFMLLVVSVWGF